MSHGCTLHTSFVTLRNVCASTQSFCILQQPPRYKQETNCFQFPFCYINQFIYSAACTNLFCRCGCPKSLKKVGAPFSVHEQYSQHHARPTVEVCIYCKPKIKIKKRQSCFRKYKNTSLQKLIMHFLFDTYLVGYSNINYFTAHLSSCLATLINIFQSQSSSIDF